MSSLAASISTSKAFLKVLLYLYLCNYVVTHPSKLLSLHLTITGFLLYNNIFFHKNLSKAYNAGFRV